MPRYRDKVGYRDFRVSSVKPRVHWLIGDRAVVMGAGFACYHRRGYRVGWLAGQSSLTAQGRRLIQGQVAGMVVLPHCRTDRDCICDYNSTGLTDQ